MITAYVLFGEANTRKSSTARALTGVGRRKTVHVAVRGRVLDVFVQVSALQESSISPLQFINEMLAEGISHVLVTLRIRQMQKRGHVFPSGVDYLRAFRTAGWRIRKVVALGTAVLPGMVPGIPLPLFVPNSRTTPVNLISTRIRKAWAWR